MLRVNNLANSLNQKRRDFKDLNAICDHDNFEQREAFRKGFENARHEELFRPKFNIDLASERDVSLRRLKYITDLKLFSVWNYLDYPTRVFTAHEMGSKFTDGSTCTKMTVQFNLFGGTVLKLGTSKHHDLLKSVDSLEKIGCFALTELGYGNNAVEMETTAHFVNGNKPGFIINSPTSKSAKYWITNSADHAQYCVVFARLIIGDSDYGIHGFLIQIRDVETHCPMPGVFIEDMGRKLGCNGVDNGKLRFHQVFAPLDSLLDKYSQVSANGDYTSVIEKKRDRFLLVANQLISGRICIASMCLGASKLAVVIATRYAQTRLTMGVSGKSDCPILDYEINRDAILPQYATILCQNFGLNFVKDAYSVLTSNRTDTSPDVKTKFSLIQELKANPQELYEVIIILTALIKPYISTSTNEVGNICRERCGGQGYLSVNRFGEIIGFGHAGMTAEGDNAVLRVKAVKEMMDLFLKKPESPASKFIKNILEYNFLNVDGDILALLKASKQSVSNCILKLQKVMMKSPSSSKQDQFTHWIKNCSIEVIDVANSFIKHLCLVMSTETLSQFKTSPNYEFLTNIVTLYGSSIQVSSDDHYVELRRSLSLKLVEKHRQLLLDFACDCEDVMLSTVPIAQDWVKYNDAVNCGEVVRSI